MLYMGSLLGVTCEHFSIFRNQQVLNIFEYNSSLIFSNLLATHIFCMAHCSVNPDCLTIVYSNYIKTGNNCFYFKRQFMANETANLYGTDIYQRKSK